MCYTFDTLQAAEKGYSMLIASMDVAPAHSELSTLKPNSRASCTRDVTVLQCRGSLLGYRPASLEMNTSPRILSCRAGTIHPWLTDDLRTASQL